MVFLPFVSQIFSNHPSIAVSQTVAALQTVQLYLYRGFLVVWVVVLGGCFASFLNVVAWRVPNGRGIIDSSKCPFCNTKLSSTANLPFYGWLSSGGRCRTCKLPIPIRYLIVEVVLGLIFLLIAIVGLGCGGWYLPTRPIDPKWGILQFVLEPKFDLLRIVIYHLIVICHLYLFALVRIQKLTISNSIIASALIATIGFQFLWPEVQQAAWPSGTNEKLLWGPHFWSTIMMGGLTGAFCGWLIWLSNWRREPVVGISWKECFFGMLIVGIGFGFQFAISVLLAILIFDSLLILLGDTRGVLFLLSPISKIGSFCLIGLVFWRVTSYFPFWPGPFSDSASLSLAIGLAMVLGGFIAVFRVDSHVESTHC